MGIRRGLASGRDRMIQREQVGGVRVRLRARIS